jgi:signal transduction histidine kinase/CheY-like chemotaxis protein
LLSAANFGRCWLTWWTGDFVSDLVVAPVLVIWLRRSMVRRLNAIQALEAALVVIVLLGTSLLVLGRWNIFADGDAYPLGFLTVPPLLWAAFRFRQRGATATTALLSIIAIWATIRGNGPFVLANQNDSLLVLQAFIGMNSLSMLVLAAVTAERCRLLQLEREARAEAERANGAKDNFLAVLSHELRTPLAPVLLTSSLLENNPEISPSLREDLRTIRRNVELEARLIDDLLDLTRIARGKMQLMFETVELHEIVRQAIEISCCDSSAVTIDVHLDAAAHHVRGDGARLQQVFWNLLNNAGKFTPEGGTISVRSRNVPGSDGGVSVIVEVADTGIGIAPDVLPRLFTAFEQVDSVPTRGPGGLGLGLAISKALVTAHGGRLHAESGGLGRGATFSVQLSAVVATERGDGNGDGWGLRESLQQSAPPTAISSTRILLVEDDEPTRLTLQKLLLLRKHRVVVANSVETAIDAASRETFDLVISDLGLPDGMGYELMRTIARTHGIGGIALSGYGMQEDIARSHQAGFVEHLVKPVDIQTLEAAIARALQSRTENEVRHD